MIRLATVFFRFFPTHDLWNRVANTLMVTTIYPFGSEYYYKDS